jgi:hypothetical protein
MCTKTGTVSHTCAKPDDCDQPNNEGFSGTSSTKAEHLTDGHRQCQTGYGGETLNFLFKDGSNCNNMMASQSGPLGTSIGCQPRTDATSSCSGNGLHVECVWSVALPACADSPTESPTTSHPTSATPPTLPPTMSPAQSCTSSNSVPPSGQCTRNEANAECCSGTCKDNSANKCA